MNELVDTVFLFISVALAWIALSVLVGTALLLGLTAVIVRVIQRRAHTAPGPDDEEPAAEPDDTAPSGEPPGHALPDPL